METILLILIVIGIYFALKLMKKGTNMMKEPFKQINEEKSFQNEVELKTKTSKKRINTKVYTWSVKQQNLKLFLNEYGKTLKEKNLYDGLTNKEIIESGKRIFQQSDYKKVKVQLIKEPDNPVDKNAVIVAPMLNDVIYEVGYLPKEIVNDPNFKIENVSNIKLYVKGGKYKDIVEDENGNLHIKTFDTPNDSYEITLKYTIEYK